MKTQTKPILGRTDNGCPYVQLGNELIQRDRHGDWNFYRSGLFVESFEKNLGEALDAIRVDPKTRAEVIACGGWVGGSPGQASLLAGDLATAAEDETGGVRA